jgi:hypothetical protein
MSLALYHSKLILGCYRTDEVSDPEVYVTAVAAVLSRYPSDIGARLSDPKDGIAGKIKWLPSISEIKEACDAMQVADVATAKRKADLAEQWRLREERERLLSEVREPTGPIISNYDEAKRPTGPFEKPGDEWNRRRQPMAVMPKTAWVPLTDEELLAIYLPKAKAE